MPLAIGGLFIALTPLPAQNCMGKVPFSEWPTRVGVSYAKPGGNEVRTALLAIERDGLLADGFYSRINPRPDPNAGQKGDERGIEVGYDWRAWHRLYFCPTLSASSGQRNGVMLARRGPATEPTNDQYLTAGGVVGPSSGMHDGVVISPTAGLWLARDRTEGNTNAGALVRNYGFAKVGVGLVVVRRFTASLSYERQFASPEAVPTFWIVAASVDVGP